MASYTLQGFTNDASSPDLDATNLNEMDNAIKVGHDFADSSSATPEAGKAMVWPDESIKVWRSDNDDVLFTKKATLSSGSITAYVYSLASGTCGWFLATNTATGLPSASYYICEFIRFDNNTAQLSVRGTGSITKYRKNLIRGTWDGFWTTEWTSDSDGAGSGLETDKIPFATKTGTSTGTQGQASFDDSYLYLCTATNIWKRVALTSF